jgi:thymidylate kinase
MKVKGKKEMEDITLKKGKFVVVDGIDGVGKGVFLDVFIEEAKSDGKKVLDVNKFWQENNFHPKVEILYNKFDVIVTSEPTFEGLGRYIREEMIANNGRDYSALATAEAYALNRRILYQNLLIPILETGVDVFQSRSVSTSIVYQYQQSKNELNNPDGTELFNPGLGFLDSKKILKIAGNVFCLKHPMDYLIIPTIEDPTEALERAVARDKDDNCQFENIEFQLKINELYRENNFRKIFEDLGTKVLYMDAGKTLGFSIEQAKDFYRNFLR